MKTIPKNKIQKKKSYYLGISLIAIGILCNKWFIEITFAPDKTIGSISYLTLIVLFDILAIIFGLYFFIKQPAKCIPAKRTLSLVFISVICTLFVLEVSARIWLNYFANSEYKQKFSLYSDLSPREFQWTKHHYLNYYPTPNYVSGLRSHNSLGYRNQEFSLQKPDGVYRIAVLGGSSTYTIKVEDNDKTFTAQLEKMLQKIYEYKKIEVINAGVSGYNSWESLINLEMRVLDVDPDLVIVYHGLDDVHTRLVSPIAYRGDNSGSRKQWEPPSIRLFERSCFLRILSRVDGFTYQVTAHAFITSPTYKGACSVNYDQNTSDDLAKELLRRNPPIYFRRNLLNMIAIAKLHDIDVVFATWTYSPHFEDHESTPHYQKGLTENNNIVKEVADIQDIKLFDFAKVMSKEKRYWADGSHVNEEGALLKAKLFASFIHKSRLISQ